MRVAAFETGLTLNGAISLQILGKADEQFFTQIGVRNFAPAELDHGFHTIAFGQKTNSVVLFEIVIVIIGIGTELQFLHLDDVLFTFARRAAFSCSRIATGRNPSLWRPEVRRLAR